MMLRDKCGQSTSDYAVHCVVKSILPTLFAYWAPCAVAIIMPELLAFVTLQRVQNVFFHPDCLISYFKTVW